jgi:hypothetical protein
LKEFNFLKTENLKSRGISPLIAAHNSMGGWLLIGSALVQNDSDYDWREALAKIIRHFGYSFIFSISVQLDFNESTVYVRIYFIND